MNEYLTAVLVTEDPEFYHAHKSHNERDGRDVFRNKVLNPGIQYHKFVHFEIILIKNGGVYADNSGWLNILCDRELDPITK